MQVSYLTHNDYCRFPGDTIRKQSWTKFVNRGSWKPNKYSVVCSKHFTEECFDRTSQCHVRLKSDAIPTLNQVHTFTDNVI